MNISIRLIRNGKKVEDSLKSNHGFTEIATQDGRLFISQEDPSEPDWFKLMRQFASDPLPQLQTQSCSAVLFLDVAQPDPTAPSRIMAIAFANGFHQLELNAFERSFGLRVALNSISRVNLRGLEVATLDATTFQRSVSASRKADLERFGVNLYSDLFRRATGTPTDASFARSLSGKDALSLSIRLDAGDVRDKCQEALRLFFETAYKNDYGFIDNITPVRETDRIRELDDAVFAEIQKLILGDSSDLHLYLPEALGGEGSEYGYFGLGFKSGPKSAFSEVGIEDYVSELQNGQFDKIGDMANLKASHEIFVIENGSKVRGQSRKIYESFVFEVQEPNGNSFVLFDGEWYEVSSSFYDEIEANFNALVSPSPLIQSTASANEKELLLELNKRSDLLLLDQRKISPKGAPGANLEPCDFLSKDRCFIHLKHGHSSSSISHLWNQGLVSASSYAGDQKFRGDLRKRVKSAETKEKKTGFHSLLPVAHAKPDPASYSVIFGIMRKANGKSKKVSVPFFSKLAFRTVAQRLKTMSFDVQVHLIQQL